MTNTFERLTDELSLVKDSRGLSRVLRKAAYNMGFEFFCYLHLKGKSSFAVSNYPKAWQDRYFSHSYDRVDPVLVMARSNEQIFAWSRTSGASGRETLKFFDEAGQVGIRSGVSIPVSVGFGAHSILTFASGDIVTKIGAVHNPVRAAIVASLVHAHMTFLQVEPTSRPATKLTPQQTLCLKWSAEGKNMEEIATLLSLAKHSVRFHLDNAKCTLGATNLQNATAIATSLNLF
ncbi:autoinducer binding domain-containing protein [Rhizobium sp. XQZ8]|uniref:autoinducer binding domain-containing protein n=1 Tax=Rhizobium populisoli TaxID=2859785 RepID=UPI001CA5C290|nr:autoinducer binding domain-containing protein [Rhizobium populisoli]MBW6425750.1 autoinducer binding domain-containing protein [Rhizobium populisoli]